MPKGREIKVFLSYGLRAVRNRITACTYCAIKRIYLPVGIAIDASSAGIILSQADLFGLKREKRGDLYNIESERRRENRDINFVFINLTTNIDVL